MNVITQFPLNCQQQVSWTVLPLYNVFPKSRPHTNTLLEHAYVSQQLCVHLILQFVVVLLVLIIVRLLFPIRGLLMEHLHSPGRS